MAGSTISTQVAVIGGGPSGTLLAHLLRRAGIESVIVEQRDREYVSARIRAGVLESGTVELLRASDLGDRMDREGYVHSGTYLSTANRGFRIDFKELTGASVMVYGQTEVQKDLYAAMDAAQQQIFDDATDVVVHDVETKRPSVTFTRHGQHHRIEADFIAGCDGYHGVSRATIPATVLREYERVYPFGWLGILSETPPVSHELIYAQHERGFALCSMRNDNLSRYYVQCDVDDPIESWTDDRFWDELKRRIPADAADDLVTGPSIEKSIAPLRSYVAEPMRFGNLFLAGDAAHIVPPTGAKGLNLAVADVGLLANALTEWYHHTSSHGLDTYSETALRRVWRAVRFSWWLTSLMHTFPDTGAFGVQVQQAELDMVSTSTAAQQLLAEQYTGIAL
jgi:p-hydroxybenzoate 3-monooxygenase